MPRGGGAIRSIGEKFSTNPVTGTGSMSVPIATSAGRSNFGPQLALAYDSGAGNSPFGFGWNLALPAVTRKTDKGLPQYLDASESDVFVLSGAEDLVPALRQSAPGQWTPELTPPVNVGAVTYRVERYRPRTEGLFARIERWTNLVDAADVHWRAVSRDNVLTVYGQDAESRIADPEDPSRVFTWLICETRDDKGNAVLYRYKAEDGAGVDLGRANERNRGARIDSRRAANRYLKRIHYGNRVPLLDAAGQRPLLLDKPAVEAQIANGRWMFEVVFDFGEHDPDTPRPNDAGEWAYRSDPFSSRRAGFEVRTTRLCQRVMMFHHFDGEPGVGRDCLVRSTDFTYSDEQVPANPSNPVYTFLQAVTQSGYRRQNAGYDKRSLPPIEFEYSVPAVQDTVHDVDAESLENLPIGVDGTAYRWTDLHGEGIPGILTEQGGAWFYKRNISPISSHAVEFAPLERAAVQPNAALSGGRAQFMDLAGDGLPDLVVMDGPMPGLYEHDEAESWQPFRSFATRLVRDTSDPNLKFVDLDGDGRADVLITEDGALIWQPSLGEAGFGPARRVAQALDEEKGPRLVFADAAQSIYLADLSGDGLTDLVRIRNGEVCYWPNLGHGHFGAKVTMDDSPRFDNPEQFDQKRIRLADIDGSGTTDIIYLHRAGVRLYFNQSGNAWSAPQSLRSGLRVDDPLSIVPADLFGNGTTCLVWSSSLPGDAQHQMRYMDLMGGQKPHLLVKTVNNLGAETRVHYASSTRFYLQDKWSGKPWLSRLPFPVNVIERVEAFDHVSRNRFVTRYAYHHGYFDGEEREFRGFGMVEQWDTEQLAALASDGLLPTGNNLAAESHVPPVLTKTWFHTGIYLGRGRVSDFFAGLLNATDPGEYFREPGMSDATARAMLLPDTVLPRNLSLDEEREACRSLKGAMLRQEVYALDGSPKASFPYTVAEQNFTIECVQPRGANRHGVFFTHAREVVNLHYERNPADPRIQHALTLEVDRFGNVLKQASVAYGRRTADASLPTNDDRERQTQLLVTYTENRIARDPVTDLVDTPIAYRTPLPCETRAYELTGITPENNAARFSFDEWNRNGFALATTATEIAYEQAASGAAPQKRLIEHVRTLYRRDDLAGLLPLGTLEALALPGETYQLAFTPGLLASIYSRPRAGQLPEVLLPNPAAVLGDAASDRGGYLQSQTLKADGRFPNTDADDHWWAPSGRVFFSDNPADSAAAERAAARQHFFVLRRYRDAFGQNATISFDAADLLIVETRDAVGNRVTVDAYDYRVLQPHRVIDPNRNRTEVAFDTLGMVVGTAVMGKAPPAPVEGDSLSGFVADLTPAQIGALQDGADPHVNAPALLQNASTRIVYDLHRFERTRLANPLDPTKWLPSYAVTLARETHASDPLPPQGLSVQITFSYSDGFGREVQKKLQAEPGPLVAGGPMLSPRWVGKGWTIFNNKGKPVRQYEPFFSTTHRFEFGVQAGVSAILFYDPVERMAAALHPNHSYEKVVFDPWRQVSWDVNDTVASDPRTDADIQGLVAAYFASLPASPPAPAWQTWLAERQGGALGAVEQAAAIKAAAHANTPATAHFDALGRPFLTLADNGLDPAQPAQHLLLASRVEHDIQGNALAARDAVVQAGDALGRVVARYAYDLLGHRIHQSSMEAGARWALSDVAGKTIRAWDSRGHTFRIGHDPLRRPLRTHVVGALAGNPNQELLTDRLVYGEQHPQAELRNLRGKLYLQLDQAGLLAAEAHDFKANPLRASRRLTSGAQYPQLVDWSTVDADLVALPTDATAPVDLAALDAALAPQLEADTYTSLTSYDALNRPATLTTPHTPALSPNVIRPSYNEAGLLERVEANLRSATANGQPVWTSFVANIDYDAKGQRERIDYGNGATTTFEHDPLTVRLVRMLTRRGAAFPTDCPQPPPAGWPGCQAQNLRYTYDPVGNITHIRDDAQQTLYFRNRRVEPSAEYTHDAVYRLIEASGREHLGQVGGAPIPHSHNDAGRFGIDWSANDGDAMGSYVERYVYDAVGNLLEVRHRGSDPVHPGWTRAYTYAESSQLEDGLGGTLAKTGNRLSHTAVGNNNPPLERYLHDAHGNMIRMPHLGGAHPAANLFWDHRDQLYQTDLGGGGTAYCVYDAGGQRVRKVWEKPGNLVEERIYLGGFEIFRRRNNAGAVTLQRETLHVMDDKQRIALVETRTLDTAGTDLAPQQLVRYQFDNHLGSACLELDERAQIISYEEYTPFGSTAYQAVRNQTDTPKRYRFTGKERDEETGLGYHGARYYAPWLGRWVACDPAGPVDSPSLYTYVGNRPIVANDPNGQWLNILIGAVAGAVIGGGIELIRQAASGGEIEWGRVGAAAAGGAVGGAIAGATFGACLAVQAAGVAVGAAVGGATTRTLLGEPTSATDVVRDVAIGLVTFGVLRGAGAVLGRARAGGGGGGRSGGGSSGSRGGGSSRGAAGRGRGAPAEEPGAPAAEPPPPRDFRARAAAGEIPPMPPIPPIPPRFPNASAFGKALGWGSKLSPEASRANAREVTREALGDTGATRSMLQGWRDVYRYLATHDPGNPSAPGRAAFLDELLSRFFPSPTGAIVPGAAAGAPAGLEPNPPGGGSASTADGGSSVSVTSPLLNSLHDWSWLGGFSSGPGAPSTSSAACGPGVAACVRRSIDSSSSGGSSAYNPETNSTTILRFGF